MRALAETSSVKVGDLFTLVRLAVTGKRISPPLFESIELLGDTKAVDSLRRAASMLRA